MRDIFLANFFGPGCELDAFFAGFLLPDFIFNFLALGFISGGLLPIFSQNKKKSPQFAEKIFIDFLKIILILVIIFSILAFIFVPYIISFFLSTTTKNSANIDLIILCTRILLISPIFFALSNSLGMFLLAKKSFWSVAIAPILNNLGVIFGIVLFGKKFGILAATCGAAAGAILHFLVRFFDFLKNWQGKFLFKINFNPELKKIFLLGLPKTLALVFFQLTLFSITIFAVKSGEGVVSAFNFARNLGSFPVSLFGISVATAAFPFLSEFSAQKNSSVFLQNLQKFLRKSLFFALPAAIGIFLLSPSIIKIFFGHGNFSISDEILTTAILTGITISIPFESMSQIFLRSFDSQQKTFFSTIGKFIFFITCFFGFLVSSQNFGGKFFGIIFSIGIILENIFLIFSAQKNFSFSVFSFLKKNWRIFFSSFFMGIFLIFFNPKFSFFVDTNFINLFLSEILTLSVKIFLGTGIYFLIYFQSKKLEKLFTKIKSNKN